MRLSPQRLAGEEALLRVDSARTQADEEKTISQRAPEDEAPTGKRQADFANTIDQALRLGWLTHFILARTLLVSLRDRPGLSLTQRALCRALLALASAALNDLPAARRLARQAIQDTARPSASMKLDQLREVRMARALAVNAGELVGDRMSARRAARVRFMAGDPRSEWLVRASSDLYWLDAPPAIRRYARFVVAVHRHFEAVGRPGVLTPAEIGILKCLATRTSVRGAARLLGRSENTIRTHLRNIYPKLGVHRRAQALSRARGLGLLDS